jgi:phosphatidylinositol alpha-mannosyltransferase
VITRFHGSLGKIPIDDTARSAMHTEMRHMGYGAIRRSVARCLNIPLWRLERAQIAQSSQVTCPSEFSRSWLSQQIGSVGSSYSVIPNGLRVDESALCGGAYASHVSLEEKTLVSVGRCSVSKGVTVLARAVPLVLAEHLDAAFVFAGPLVDLRVARVLSGLAERYPGKVRILGRIPHDQALRWLSSSYLLVHPSFHEVFPMVLLEAMALGVPAVTSNAGPLPEIVENSVPGNLFPVGDHEALARSILTLLDSSGTRLEMGKACRSRFAARFCMEVVAQQLVDFYEEVAGAGYDGSSARKGDSG